VSGRHAARHGRRRTTWILLGVVAAIAAVAGVVTAVLLRGPTPPEPPGPTPTATTTTPAVQRTLLLQVRNDDDIAVNNVLLGTGGGPDRAVFLNTQPGLLVDVAGVGTTTLGETAALPDTLASVDAMTDLLGVRVDGGFTLDRLAFAGLVDAVGGVPVDVRREIVVLGQDDEVIVTIPAGARTLNGIEATYYVTTLLPGEREQARIRRFSEVLPKVLAELPDTPERMRQLLTSLGALARSTVPTDDLVTILLSLRDEVLRSRAVQETLPATALRRGGQNVFLLDQQAAEVMVRDLLPEAVLAPGEGQRVRVLVQNGDGMPGLGAYARDRLVEAGFAFVSGGNADQFGYPKTLVLLPDGTDASRERGLAVAEALGVPPNSLRVGASGQTVADVLVILGADFARDVRSSGTPTPGDATTNPPVDGSTPAVTLTTDASPSPALTGAP
jgi:hypothetical protein